jgi:thiol-disulfide isomerase/thioredoxin
MKWRLVKLCLLFSGCHGALASKTAAMADEGDTMSITMTVGGYPVVFQHVPGSDPTLEVEEFCESTIIPLHPHMSDCADRLSSAVADLHAVATGRPGNWAQEAAAAATATGKVAFTPPNGDELIPMEEEMTTESSDLDAVLSDATLSHEEEVEELNLDAPETAAAAAAAAAAASVEAAATGEESTKAAVAEAAEGGGLDLEFEVMVSADGAQATFVHHTGRDPETEVAAFCAEHVGEEYQAQCSSTLLSTLKESIAEQQASAGRGADSTGGAAVRSATAADSAATATAMGASYDDDAQLAVMVDARGGTQQFVHAKGGDATAEATAFCTSYVPSANLKACAAQLVQHLDAHLQKKQQQAGTAGTSPTGGMTGGAGSGGQGLARLLGPMLTVAGGAKVGAGASVETASALAGKVVGLYFAADWCKPCRQFTPLLAKYYAKVKDFKRKKFEVVWLSASREEGGFNGYLKEMPWLALPFSNREVFDVSGIKQIANFLLEWLVTRSTLHNRRFGSGIG